MEHHREAHILTAQEEAKSGVILDRAIVSKMNQTNKIKTVTEKKMIHLKTEMKNQITDRTIVQVIIHDKADPILDYMEQILTISQEVECVEDLSAMNIDLVEDIE